MGGDTNLGNLGALSGVRPMKIPSSFKKAIARTFYDKAMQLCAKVSQTDEFGAVVGSGYEPILSFKGSFQPTSSTSDLDEFGNYSDGTFRVACDLAPKQVSQQDNVVLYDGVYYEIMGKYPTDSALVLTVREAGK